MFEIDGFTINSYDKLTGYDTEGNLDIIMENLKDFSLTQKNEKTILKPEFDNKIFKKNTLVTGSGTNKILTLDSYEMALGESFKNDNYIVRFSDEVTVKNDSARLNKIPVGKRIYSICTGVNKRQRSLKLTQTAEKKLNNNSFVYSSENNSITFNSSMFEDGTTLIVYYDISTSGSRITNYVYHYNKILEIYIDVTCQGNKADEKFKGQFHVFQSDFSAEFSISGNRDRSVQSFEFKSIGDKRGSKLVHWDFTVFNE